MRAEFKANARLKQELEASRDTGYGMGTQTDCSQEDDLKYHNRAQEASTYLKAQLSLFSGNVALFTHATTAMSLAYGLCDNLHEDVEQWFQEYVTENKPKGVNVNPKDFSEHPRDGSRRYHQDFMEGRQVCSPLSGQQHGAPKYPMRATVGDGFPPESQCVVSLLFTTVYHFFTRNH